MKLGKLDKKGTRVPSLRFGTSSLLNSKRSAEKYYLVISIILGLIILIIAIYWIFQEYFGQDEINRETCRQGIILRASMPESERLATRSLDDLRNNFPLKCKTEVVDVSLPKDFDESFSQNVSKLIADKMAECWNLFGEGNYLVFPLAIKEQKSCVICSRIHFSVGEIPDNYRKAYVLSYFYTHYVGGKEIPESKTVLKREGDLVSYNSVENSYASYLEFNGGADKDNTNQFPNSDNWANSKTGRSVIDLGQGDIVIGVYSYTNTKLEWNWPPQTAYRWMRPFYSQVGIDNFNGCNFDGVPA